MASYTWIWSTLFVLLRSSHLRSCVFLCYAYMILGIRSRCFHFNPCKIIGEILMLLTYCSQSRLAGEATFLQFSLPLFLAYTTFSILHFWFTCAIFSLLLVSSTYSFPSFSCRCLIEFPCEVSCYLVQVIVQKSYMTVFRKKNPFFVQKCYLYLYCFPLCIYSESEISLCPYAPIFLF
jgi:hypothetical protein